MNFFNETGTKIPNNPATIIFKIIATAISIDKSICLNQKLTITPAIIAKMENIPSVFYNTTNFRKYKKVHDVQVLYNKIELNNWMKKL